MKFGPTTIRQKALRCFFNLAYIIPFLVIDSCSLFAAPLSARAIIEHEYGSALSVTVFLEGPDGRSMDAASIILTDVSGDALLLRYDGDIAAYSGVVPQAEKGKYTITVRSAVANDDLIFTVPFEPLSAQPIILSIQDDQGAAYELGDKPSAARAINMSWDTVPGAMLYTVNCIRNGTVLYSGNAEAGSMTIPAGTLSVGTMSFSVEAQYISGDPLLRESAFYAVSVSRAPTVICAVAP